MSTTFAIADYFAAPRVSFWRWSDYGEVAGWTDGRAIAFRPEIEAVISRLAAQGLPPFSAVLLVLAACRENWDEPPLRAELLSNLLDCMDEADRYMEQLQRAFMALQIVHKAWSAARDQPDIKARLATLVFDGIREAPTAAADELVRQLHHSDLPTRYAPVANTICRSLLVRSLATVFTCLSGVTTSALLARLKTGVDETVLPAPMEPVESYGSARSLLNALEDDPELAGVANLARQVLATLNLPRAVSDPDELPDGGLSDITNRGTLDRLLLSELAHDDLTLSVRVALREALYLRREAPPSTPPRRRAVLVDCGLRMWGVPRVFATSVALAIAAHSDATFDVTVAHTDGAQAVPVDVTSREGVLAHLEALDYHVQPAAALHTLVEELDNEAVEIVLVTTDDVLADPDFLAALAQLKLATLYLATVAREGAYRLWLRTGGGSRLLKAATFDLEKVLAPGVRKRGLYDRDRATALPAIFQASPFPLLLSAGVHPERAWHSVKQMGVLSATRDGRLLRWSHPGRGGELLAEHLPAGHVQWADTHENLVIAVIGPLKKRGLHVCQFYDDRHGTHCSEIHPLQLGEERPMAVAGHAGLIYVIYARMCEVFDLQGNRLQSLVFGDLYQWMGGRFFYAPVSHRWEALGWNGQQIELHDVLDSRLTPPKSISVLEGPTLITADGEAYFRCNQRNEPPYRFAPRSGGKGKVTAISRDERFLLYHADYQREPWPLLVDLERRQTSVYRAKVGPFVEPLLGQYARPRTLRHRLSAIGVDAERRLVLFSSGGCWPLSLSPDGHLLLPKRATPSVQCQRIAFRQHEGSWPYELKFAEWPDGSIAAVDSRGLLHLRSADSSISECSIVLSEGETAGWTADGRWWGSAYFIGEHPRTPAAEIYRDILRPFAERLPCN